MSRNTHDRALDHHGTEDDTTVTLSATITHVGNAGDTLHTALSNLSSSSPANTHAEPLTDGASNFFFMNGDVIVLVGVPN